MRERYTGAGVSILLELNPDIDRRHQLGPANWMHFAHPSDCKGGKVSYSTE